MSDKLDVVGIGNAMVDAIIPSNQSEIEKHEINRDSMNLICLLYTSPSPRDFQVSRMPSSA